MALPMKDLTELIEKDTKMIKHIQEVVLYLNLLLEDAIEAGMIPSYAITKNKDERESIQIILTRKEYEDE